MSVLAAYLYIAAGWLLHAALIRVIEQSMPAWYIAILILSAVVYILWANRISRQERP